ncbi:GyrI-like domain-containing protein [Muricauda sp. ANG21]|uniref:GyrI-like domain-containing protein n=1 Tax=Allomuricauda sp. ANG21 TaxID=3042468 RepID=UPI0034529CDF
MRKISILVLTLLVIAIFWYLFLKPQDYQVSFKAKALPGTVFETVKAWNKTLDSVVPVQFETLEDFSQIIVTGDSLHTYQWNITKVHDSLSQVDVNIKDKDHSLMNKIKIPFSDTDFEKGSRKTLLDFNQFLKVHLEKFKVSIVGEEELFSTFCACVPLTTEPGEKAGGIMANYTYLSSTIFENGVEPNGPPFLEVEEWDIKSNSLSYNFCFPIVRSEKLPMNPSIKYKRIFNKPALKAIYNGNYVTSDRAWYALVNYAEENNIPIEKKPIEVFFNNPNMGGNEMEWTTEVYMPIKE